MGDLPPAVTLEVVKSHDDSLDWMSALVRVTVVREEQPINATKLSAQVRSRITC
jgi:hypothetical protein